LVKIFENWLELTEENYCAFFLFRRKI